MSKSDLTPIVLLDARQQSKVIRRPRPITLAEIKALKAGDMVTLCDGSNKLALLAVQIEQRKGNRFTGRIYHSTHPKTFGHARIAFHADNIVHQWVKMEKKRREREHEASQEGGEA
jgi:hypothetical protein